MQWRRQRLQSHQRRFLDRLRTDHPGLASLPLPRLPGRTAERRRSASLLAIAAASTTATTAAATKPTTPAGAATPGRLPGRSVGAGDGAVAADAGLLPRRSLGHGQLEERPQHQDIHVRRHHARRDHQVICSEMDSVILQLFWLVVEGEIIGK